MISSTNAAWLVNRPMISRAPKANSHTDTNRAVWRGAAMPASTMVFCIFSAWAGVNSL